MKDRPGDAPVAPSHTAAEPWACIQKAAAVSSAVPPTILCIQWEFVLLMPILPHNAAASFAHSAAAKMQPQKNTTKHVFLHLLIYNATWHAALPLYRLPFRITRGRTFLAATIKKG